MVRKGSHSRGPDGATILAPGHQGATSASAELSKRPTVLASAGTWVITAYQTSAGGPPCVHSPRPPASVWSWPADPSLGVPIVQPAAQAAGLEPAWFAGYRLRAGPATSAAMAGAEERSIMHQTRHRSAAAARRSIQEGSLSRNNMADQVGLWCRAPGACRGPAAGTSPTPCAALR